MKPIRSSEAAAAQAAAAQLAAAQASAATSTAAPHRGEPPIAQQQAADSAAAGARHADLAAAGMQRADPAATQPLPADSATAGPAPWHALARLGQAGRQALVLAAPFVLFGLFLLFYDVNPLALYTSMLASTFGDLYGFGEVLVVATPIVLTGLAAALPARAGLINVGGEGQLAIGALFATWFAVFYLAAAPSWLGLPVMLLAGALGGGLWAGITAFLKTKGNMNETITSLLLNYVAFFTVGYFVHGALKDPASFNWPFSPEIGYALRLPVLNGTRLHIGIFVAVALVALVWFVLNKTRAGFRIRVLGSNPFAAQRAGFRVSRMQFWVLVAAGAIAGVAGMIEIAGVEGRLRPSTGVNYGYLGFLAAWMAWNHPLRLMVTGFVLGMIAVAGNTLEMQSGLPSSSVNILMGLVLLFLLGSSRFIRKGGRKA